MVREGVNPFRRRALVAACAAALVALSACTTPGGPAAPGLPPPAPREFRAAWVASVANIDWPSRPGLPVAEQQEEIRRIVDRAAAMNLNALIVQVRPAADALYASSLEPWSEYLGGEQGKPPEPFYDPLATWIEEAHRRGIELHAWFNPYRARHPSARSPLAANHVANAAPGIVKAYGDVLWMDPGEPESARRTLAAITDVVRRYDVDGVHIDDYFYPYPVKAPGDPAADLDFPDEPSWQAYLRSGGTLSRADWRRRNVDTLVEALCAAVHREKPWVRVGVSPFGVGRPDRRPPGVTGFSQYDRLYADVELWLASGWIDYLVPQLYWPVEQPGQPFAPLLEYWMRENTQGRHVWPGLFTSRIDDTPKSWAPSEIAAQIGLARSRGANGQAHFSMAALLQDRKGIATRLASVEYARPALVPATPWLGADVPVIAKASAWLAGRGAASVSIEVPPGWRDRAWLYAIWSRHGGDWTFSTHRATATDILVPPDGQGRPADVLVVSVVSRLGIESARALLDVSPDPAQGARP